MGTESDAAKQLRKATNRFKHHVANCDKCLEAAKMRLQNVIGSAINDHRCEEGKKLYKALRDLDDLRKL